MRRVRLIHWNAAEGEERAALLKRAGYRVDFDAKLEPEGLRAFRANPPDAFVIDLSRLPSHGRAVATVLRQQKATRTAPIVFAGGDPEKVARTRELLPDAVYTGWDNIRGALEHGWKNPPAAPVVPATMQGYSGTPLPKKLGIRPGSTVALLGAPEGFERNLQPLPEGVRLLSRAGNGAERVLLFVKSRAEMARRFGAATRAVGEKGGLWIVWPKQASGVATDLTQPDVRAFGLEAGWVDYKICAVDETWSGLLFARRR